MMWPPNCTHTHTVSHTQAKVTYPTFWQNIKWICNNFFHIIKLVICIYILKENVFYNPDANTFWYLVCTGYLFLVKAGIVAAVPHVQSFTLATSRLLLPDFNFNISYYKHWIYLAQKKVFDEVSFVSLCMCVCVCALGVYCTQIILVDVIISYNINRIFYK